jgi:hypothetical protein
MKKIIFFSISILIISFVKAQTPAEIKIAENFIISRADAYIKKAIPVFVNNLAALEKVERNLDAKKISYRKYSFVFIGEINDKNCVGGAMHSYTQNNRKPILYYTILKENEKTEIWVISGHNGF